MEWVANSLTYICSDRAAGGRKECGSDPGERSVHVDELKDVTGGVHA